MKKTLSLILATVFIAVGSTSASAQASKDAGPLGSRLDAVKLVDGKAAGTADKVQPGDTVLYTAVYTNRSDSTLGNLKLTLPVPAGTEYQTNFVLNGSVLEASLDGQIFSQTPIYRTVTQADGTTTKVVVSPRLYKAVRWNVPSLTAHSSVEIGLQVKVNSSTTQ